MFSIQIPENFDLTKFMRKYKLSRYNCFIHEGRLYSVIEFPDLSDCIDLWGSIRMIRNELLSGCDWSQLPDAILTIEEKQAWQDYRQALRDLPQDFETPDDVIFPTPPGGV